MADDSKYPTRIAPYGLRMEPDLKARIQSAADANKRSLHSEILEALEVRFPPPRKVSDITEQIAILLSTYPQELRNEVIEALDNIETKEHLSMWAEAYSNAAQDYDS